MTCLFSVSPQILSMRHVLGTCVVRTYLFPGLKNIAGHDLVLTDLSAMCTLTVVYILPNGLKLTCCLFFPLIDHSQSEPAATGTTEDRADRSKI